MGRFGEVRFMAGFYVYVGSARRGFRVRLGHYLKSVTRSHWHIDHLMACARLSCVVLGETKDGAECRLAAALGERLKRVPHFGSSDCRCSDHLFVAENEEEARLATIRALQSLKLWPLTMDESALRSFLGL